MMDYIRTLIWCNTKRLKQHKLPLLKMPANKFVPSDGSRSSTCPVARAIGGVVGFQTWRFRKDDLVAGGLPEYVKRFINRADKI